MIPIPRQEYLKPLDRSNTVAFVSIVPQGAAIRREGQAIDRTANAAASTVEHMSVDHGGAQVFVAEEVLDRPDVAAAFEKIRWEGVAIMAIVSWNGLLDVLPVDLSPVAPCGRPESSSCRP